MPLLDPLISALRPLVFQGKGRLFNWCTPHTGCREITIAGSSRMKLDLANAQHRQIFMGCLNIELQKTMRATLRPGDTFLDVGANVGFLSLLGAHLTAPGGRAIAVEPFAPSFQSLQANVQLSGAASVDAHNIALAEAPGELRLFVPPASEHREFNVSIVQNERYESLTVPARTLDDCLDEWRVERIRLMKIDVEGSEAAVFRGAKKSLECGRIEYISCEMNAGYLKALGSSQAALCREICSYGFRPARIRRGRAVALDAEPVFDERGDDDQLFVHQQSFQ